MSGEADYPVVQPVHKRDDLPVARPARRTVHSQPSGFSALLSWFFRLVLVASLVTNIIFLIIYLPQSKVESSLSEKYYTGQSVARDKVAIVRIDGTLLEGLTGFATQQIRDAARDDDVKAVVVAVNSPGGSVTASDQLYRQIIDLRDGKWVKPSGKNTQPKPVVVAMESVAASGGYYIAVPAHAIFAEPTTITGSIGVYIPVIDLHELAEKYGVKVHLIKKGELKGSGSMFKALSPEERLEFDENIEATYQRFMSIVKEGRGNRLKYGLREEIQVPLKTKPGETWVRRLADGGVFTAEQAKEFGLIDEIGYTSDAIAHAKKLAGLDEAQVITYSRPISLSDALLNLKADRPGAFNLRDIPGATARMWYLTPGYELSGVQVPEGWLK
jgi:protease-4